MSHIIWTDELATGIDVIDAQHKRIINYINELAEAYEQEDSTVVREILLHLVDYTLYHFAFEEAMMQDAGYDALPIHQQTHHAFTNKIHELTTRFENGEDITEELYYLLNIWLIDHIADDDSSYVPYVIENIPNVKLSKKPNRLVTRLQQFFS